MLVIGSFNVQNKFWISHYNGKLKEQDLSLLFKDFLYKYHIDILGTQEFVTWYLEKVKHSLHHYTIVGNFRYPKTFLKRYNETNSIITKHPIEKHKTYRLPTFPVFPPRIITKATIKTNEFGEITLFNTHLTLKNKRIQKKQLKEILNLIQECPTPIILTGDFNMTIHNSLMIEFINELKKRNIIRVPIMEKTYKHHKKENAIDHIFLSDIFQIEKYQVIKEKNLDNFSDHYPILVWIKKTN